VVRNTRAQELQHALRCIHNATNVFEVISVNVILTTNYQGDNHEALEIVHHEWRQHQLQVLKEMFETSWWVEKLTVKMVLPEDGDNKRWNM
jgi:hypothetical protein